MVLFGVMCANMRTRARARSRSQERHQQAETDEMLFVRSRTLFANSNCWVSDVWIAIGDRRALLKCRNFFGTVT